MQTIFTPSEKSFLFQRLILVLKTQKYNTIVYFTPKSIIFKYLVDKNLWLVLRL